MCHFLLKMLALRQWSSHRRAHFLAFLSVLSPKFHLSRKPKFSYLYHIFNDHTELSYAEISSRIASRKYPPNRGTGSLSVSDWYSSPSGNVLPWLPLSVCNSQSSPHPFQRMPLYSWFQIGLLFTDTSLLALKGLLNLRRTHKTCILGQGHYGSLSLKMTWILSLSKFAIYYEICSG